MPTVSTPVPPPPDNRHLAAVSSLSRNDSLKSERSDKRVSFNNDVGIKHIPRGGTNKTSPPHLGPPPKQKAPDEWAECKPVKLQPNKLSAEELEKEAANLVTLVDSINCQASPAPKRKNKEFNSRSLDRTQKKNNVKGNGQINGGLNYTRITNPIIRHLKADVNRRDNRRRDIYYDSDSDRYYQSQLHKSVPNLVAASTKPHHLQNGIENSLNYSSVDNLLHEKNVNQVVNKPRITLNSHHSADNLIESEPDHPNLVGFKSLGDLPTYSDSDSDRPSRSSRPKVNQIIKKLNGHPETTNSSVQRDPSPTRGIITPSRQNSHNDNKPFSYTEPKSVTSLQKVRNKSPTRENNIDDMYAQVNKRGLNQRLSMDSDYSAKIIITEDKPKTSYDGDDEAYETFNVQHNTLKNNRFSDFNVNFSSSKDDITSKNNAFNNNINMSSVAVQTDAVSRALNKARHNKGMAPQPPAKEVHYENFGSSRKGLSSELTSADLVRQINHGFGRIDRSPSPPPRKLLNRSNQRPHIPLLSDTSDSETEYRRRSDPLAKIRNQVHIGESLEEDHDGEEWEERENERYLRMNQNSRYNAGEMRPLTIDEVDALSLEYDQHGDRKLVVSNKSGEKRSTSLHTTQHHTEARESHTDRSFSEDRGRPIKPLREKGQSNRESSASRQFTLEKNKKNNLEREKFAQEKKPAHIEKENGKKSFKDTLRSNKGKDKKNKDKDTIKDKKKKRIKIKFFYDPRPQDKSTEDPLSRFTEYKGKDYQDVPDKIPKTPRSRSYDSRSQSRERNLASEVSVNPKYVRDSSRERTLLKPDRNRRTAGSTDQLLTDRRVSGNSSHEDSDDRRRVRSTDSYDRRNRYENVNFSGGMTRDQRRTKLGYEREDNVYERKRDDYGYQNSKQNGLDKYDDYNDSAEEAIRRRNTFLERREAYERRDNEVRRQESFSPGRGDTVDRRREPYRGDDRKNYHTTSPSDESPTRGDEKYISSPDDDDRQERVLRQRKKFLSALMTDGRAKSSNPSAAVKRSQSTAVHQPPRFSSSYDDNAGGPNGGHDSDPPPRPISAISRKDKAGESTRVWSSKVHDQRETRQWENATIQRPSGRAQDHSNDRQYGRAPLRGPRRTSEGSSGSSAGPRRVDRTPSFKQRYFGDSDNDRSRNRPRSSGPGDYRSLPNRTNRPVGKRILRPAGGGSAGSSLQSSESENDSHQGSRASHVSTGSNRSVYLHATAVADIPVQKEESEKPGVQRQTKKVARSFSLVAPWKPRHTREQYEYDNKEARHAARPPRPPRKTSDPVSRSQTLTNKDNKLSGWLKKRKNKEGKGI